MHLLVHLHWLIPHLLVFVDLAQIHHKTLTNVQLFIFQNVKCLHVYASVYYRWSFVELSLAAVLIYAAEQKCKIKRSLLKSLSYLGIDISTNNVNPLGCIKQIVICILDLVWFLCWMPWHNPFYLSRFSNVIVHWLMPPSG